jgi:hypothetical protein
MHFTLIALLILAVLAILIGYMVRIGGADQRRVKERLKKRYAEWVEKKRMTIDTVDNFRKRIIAYDRLGNQLLLIDLSKEQEEAHVIDLENIASCRTVKNKHEANGHINGILLECVGKRKNQPVLQFPFYDELEDSLQDMLFLQKRAEFWEHKLNIHISASANTDKAGYIA